LEAPFGGYLSCNPNFSVSNVYASCVFFAKKLLNIDAFVVTPVHLYNWLISHGGVELTANDYKLIEVNAMGSFGGGNKQAKQASEQARQQLAEQKRVNNVEIGRIGAETDKLTRERIAAEQEAAKIKEENERRKKMIATRSGGRSSLITNLGGEQGDTLG
jgi:hypothetical protein